MARKTGAPLHPTPKAACLSNIHIDPRPAQVLPRAVPSPHTTFSWEEIQEIQYEPMLRDFDHATWVASTAQQRLSAEATGGAGRDELDWALAVSGKAGAGGRGRAGGMKCGWVAWEVLMERVGVCTRTGWQAGGGRTHRGGTLVRLGARCCAGCAIAEPLALLHPCRWGACAAMLRQAASQAAPRQPAHCASSLIPPSPNHHNLLPLSRSRRPKGRALPQLWQPRPGRLRGAHAGARGGHAQSRGRRVRAGPRRRAGGGGQGQRQVRGVG